MVDTERAVTVTAINLIFGMVEYGLHSLCMLFRFNGLGAAKLSWRLGWVWLRLTPKDITLCY
jgi:hypothetical protein